MALIVVQSQGISDENDGKNRPLRPLRPPKILPPMTVRWMSLKLRLLRPKQQGLQAVLYSTSSSSLACTVGTLSAIQAPPIQLDTYRYCCPTNSYRHIEPRQNQINASQLPATSTTVAKTDSKHTPSKVLKLMHWKCQALGIVEIH